MHARAKLLPHKGGALSRFIILSNRQIYSVSREGGAHRQLEWSADAAEVSAIEQVELKDRRAPSYPYGLTVHWKGPQAGKEGRDLRADESTTFVLKGREEMVALTTGMRQLYKHRTRSKLSVKLISP